MKAMITNGGPHPADMWADATTDTILDLIQIADDSVSEEAAAARQAKRDLRPVLFNIFMFHHVKVQNGEQRVLKEIGHHKAACEHCAKDIEVHPEVTTVLIDVNKVFQTTPFAAHFAQEHVQAVLRSIVGQHTADVLHIERRYHVDRLAAKGA